MTVARKHILDQGEAVYHCISRCVRRAFLCGYDSVTRKNFDYRKSWIHSRLVFLSQIFAIDVLTYALMDSHKHLLLRTRPDILAALSDREIALRWLQLYPPNILRTENGTSLHKYIDLLAANTERIKVLRSRLQNISWYLKSVNEYIARRANREDECSGRFWEGRFKCQRLYDEAAILSCAIYVDLNPIRAKIVQTPEESKFTGACERIHALKENRAPLWLAPIADTRSAKGFLSISTTEYLTILDQSGREIKKGKRGSIPSEIAPILERLGIKSSRWLDSCEQLRKWFGYAIGPKRELSKLAQSLGQGWVKGIGVADTIFT